LGGQQKQKNARNEYLETRNSDISEKRGKKPLMTGPRELPRPEFGKKRKTAGSAPGKPNGRKTRLSDPNENLRGGRPQFDEMGR